MPASTSTSPNLSQLEHEFKNNCLTHSQPLSYYHYVIQSAHSHQFENQNQAQRFMMYHLADQINQIRKGESTYDRINIVANERDSLIRELRAEMIQGRHSKLLNLSTACEKLENVRVYTLLGLEKIASIRLESGIQRSQFYLEMIDRLTQGLEFLKFSALRKHIQFSSQSDPLFMTPYRKFWDMTTGSDFQRRPVIDLFTLDLQIRHRLQAAERFLQTMKRQEKAVEEDQDIRLENKVPSKKEGKQIFPQVIRFRNSATEDEGEVRKELVSNLIRQAVNQFGQKRFPNKNRKRVLSRSIEQQQKSIHKKIGSLNKDFQMYQQLGRTQNSRKKKADRLPAIQHRSYIGRSQPIKGPRSRYKTESTSNIYRTPAKEKPGRILHFEPRISIETLSKQQRRDLLKQLLESSSKAESRQSRSRSGSHKGIQQISKLHRLESLQDKDEVSILSSVKKKQICRISAQYSYQQRGRVNESIGQGITQIVHSGPDGSESSNGKNQREGIQNVQGRVHAVPAVSRVDSRLIEDEKEMAVGITNQRQLAKDLITTQNKKVAQTIGPSGQNNSGKASTLPQQKNQEGAIKLGTVNTPMESTVVEAQTVQGVGRKLELSARSSKQTLINKIDDLPLESSTPRQGQQSQTIPDNRGHLPKNTKTEAPYFSDREIAQQRQGKVKKPQEQNKNSKVSSMPAELERNNTSNPSKSTLEPGKETKTVGGSVPHQTTISYDEPKTKSNHIQKTQQVSSSHKETAKQPLKSSGGTQKQPGKFRPASRERPSQVTPEVKPEPRRQIVIPETPQLAYDSACTTPNFTENQQSKNIHQYAQIYPHPVKQEFKQRGGMPSIIMEAQNQSSSISMLNLTKGQLHSPGKKQFSITPIPIQEQNQHEPLVQEESLKVNNTTLAQKNVEKQEIRVNLGQSLAESVEPVQQPSQQNISQQIPPPIQVKTQAHRQTSRESSQKNTLTLKRPGTAMKEEKLYSVPETIKQNNPASLSRSEAVNLPRTSSNPSQPPPSRQGDPFQTQLSSVRGSEQRFQFGKEESYASLLKKCVFQSRALPEEELMKQIKSLTPERYDMLEEYMTKTFFGRRHLVMSSCLVDQQVVAYSLYFPQIVPTGRNVFLLTIEIIERKTDSLQTSLLSTFFNYVFRNDPCQQIIYLKHSALLDRKTEECLKKTQFFDGVITTPLKSPLLQGQSLKFIRKSSSCKNEEVFTFVLSSIVVMAAPNQEPALHTPQKGKVKIANGYLTSKIKQFKNQDVMSFPNQTLLKSYLNEQSLPLFKLAKFSKQSFLVSEIHEECLTRARFFAYSKFINFTIESPVTNFCETENAFFFLLASTTPNRYYLMGDKLYDEEDLDLRSEYMKALEGKPLSMWQNEKVQGKVVACPFFKKQTQFLLGGGVGSMLIEMNWQDYIKGVRYLAEDKVDYWLMSPFFYGEIEVNSNGNINLLFSLQVTQKDRIQ